VMQIHTNSAGVGPHPQPWPTDPRYDPKLLELGDARNVQDKYRYWTVDAIKADLDQHRSALEIAVENLERDFNMGTIIRNANAFNVAKVHIIGRRQWNKRGAMATDLYMNVEYHATVEDFVEAARRSKKMIIAVDIVEGAKNLEDTKLPSESILVFGSEGPGLSDAMLQNADQIVKIDQTGSTRSLNVGVASGIAMYIWQQQQR
jgi:tRNA G18 (ribose-2'-O)-methylase SpoU